MSKFDRDYFRKVTIARFHQVDQQLPNDLLEVLADVAVDAIAPEILIEQRDAANELAERLEAEREAYLPIVQPISPLQSKVYATGEAWLMKSLDETIQNIRTLLKGLDGLTLSTQMTDPKRHRLWGLVDSRSGDVLFIPAVSKYDGTWTTEIGRARTLAILICNLVNYAPALLDKIERLKKAED